jgi:hypothetical protein
VDVFNDAGNAQRNDPSPHGHVTASRRQSPASWKASSRASIPFVKSEIQFSTVLILPTMACASTSLYSVPMTIIWQADPKQRPVTCPKYLPPGCFLALGNWEKIPRPPQPNGSHNHQFEPHMLPLCSQTGFLLPTCAFSTPESRSFHSPNCDF